MTTETIVMMILFIYSSPLFLFLTSLSTSGNKIMHVWDWTDPFLRNIQSQPCPPFSPGQIIQFFLHTPGVYDLLFKYSNSVTRFFFVFFSQDSNPSGYSYAEIFLLIVRILRRYWHVQKTMRCHWHKISLTPRIRAKRYHWHRGVKHSGIIDTAESDSA